MTYARDPYDTEQPPCFCDQEAGAVLTTQEFCPAHGDPAKPAQESPDLGRGEELARLSDLTAFLRARLDEDEHWAQMATAGWPPKAVTTVADDPERYAWMPTDITPSKATFILRHDPARVLREVEAGRAILDLLDRAARYRDRVFSLEPPRSVSDEVRAVTTMMTLEAVVKLRAAAYSDHPDYARAVSL